MSFKTINLNDAGYPDNLKSIYDPPKALHVLGEIKPEDKFAVAIVGSRRATYYGLAQAEMYGAQLASKGITVVSGMARGIDSAAHRGALKSGGRTIAVIGSGFNNIYPQENKELAKEIAKNGAVVTEFPVDTKPLPQNFPQRNRVISGLGLGVLVVEAAKNSGALITADFALEQGREVFALPGKIDSGNSYGTNELIKQGAKLVTCVEEILEELIVPLGVLLPPPGLATKKQAVFEFGDREESEVYGMISGNSVGLDGLIEKTNLDISKISDILLRLQLKKMIRQLPGKQFVRS
ncbi:MAG: DNA-processing protein DprA [Candidatus Omnitrophica bacterium]|nr:DNA-processing protein DprA [Candidatus Omnitrophota bacterium]